MMPSHCFAILLTQYYKHEESVDLLCKSLLPHVWRVPSSKALSCKHERLFDLLTLASCYIIMIAHVHIWCALSSDAVSFEYRSCDRLAHINAFCNTGTTNIESAGFLIRMADPNCKLRIVCEHITNH